MKLNPETHRYDPIARPGEDAVGALKRREAVQLQGIAKESWGIMDIWERILAADDLE